jgi:hypothetical protein
VPAAAIRARRAPGARGHALRVGAARHAHVVLLAGVAILAVADAAAAVA